jgi:hypothetical protein
VALRVLHGEGDDEPGPACARVSLRIVALTAPMRRAQAAVMPSRISMTG